MDDATRNLVDRATRGDAVAVDHLLQRFLPGLHAYVRRNASDLVAAKETPGDLVQSICREVLEEAGDFEDREGGEDAFGAWLYQKALWRLQDKHKFYRRAKRDVLKEVHDSRVQLDRPHEGGRSPSSMAAEGERGAAVRAAVASMPAGYRQVIEWVQFDGLSYKEVAARLDKTDGAVRTLYARALSKLAQVLDSDAAQQ